MSDARDRTVHREHSADRRSEVELRGNNQAPCRRVIVVTGTDTGVGKTIATAALAASVQESVQVIKPAQTGLADPDEFGDAKVVTELAGCPAQEYVGLGPALAPSSVGRLEGRDLPTVAEHAARIREDSRNAAVTIVEGAGGLLVRLDNDGGTLLDLAADLDRDPELAVEIVIVCRAGLGTLNHTELTVAAIRHRDLEPTGLIIGSWPEQPGLAESANRVELPQNARTPLLAVLPEGAGRLSPERFRADAAGWFVR